MSIKQYMKPEKKVLRPLSIRFAYKLSKYSYFSYIIITIRRTIIRNQSKSIIEIVLAYFWSQKSCKTVFLDCFIAPFIRNFESSGHFVCLALKRGKACKIYNRMVEVSIYKFYGTILSNLTIT